MQQTAKLATRLATIATAAVLTLGLAACGSDGPKTAGASTSSSSAANAPAGDGKVGIKDFKYSPESITVKAGTPVMVTNNDNQPHTVTSDTAGKFDSDSIAGNASAPAIMIAEPGTYPYHCKFHAFMHGTIVVQ
ncbi:MAG: cupredoxin domain-containing protein [Acidimicrobiales bacterium]